MKDFVQSYDEVSSRLFEARLNHGLSVALVATILVDLDLGDVVFEQIMTSISELGESAKNLGKLEVIEEYLSRIIEKKAKNN